jgi:hypothetical protein
MVEPFTSDMMRAYEQWMREKAKRRKRLEKELTKIVIDDVKWKTKW